MKITIEKIEIASFGKLKNVSLKAEEGINILSAPNESGKTTLASFIKFVLYGYSKERARSISENDRKLYTPWGGEALQGNITLTADGKRYNISRLCTPSGKETCEIINRTTGKPEFSGAVPGEVFFGVSSEVFVRTLFFRQLTLPQNKEEEVAEKLQNIAMSADESIGSEKAKDKLKKCKNELEGRGGNGIIPKDVAERDAIDTTLSQTAGMRAEITALREEIKSAKATLAKAESNLANLEKEKENIEKYEAYLRLSRINRLRHEEETLREEYEAAASMLKNKDSNGVYHLTTLNTELILEKQKLYSIQKELEEERANKESLLASIPFTDEEGQKIRNDIKANKRKSTIAFALAAIAAVVGGVLMVTAGVIAGVIALALAVAFVVAGVVIKGKNPAKPFGFATIDAFESTYLLSAETKKRISASDEEIKRLGEILDLCENTVKNRDARLLIEIQNYIAAENTDDYGSKIEAIRNYLAESEKRGAVWQTKKAELDNALADVNLEELVEKAKDAVEPKQDRNIVEQGIRFCNNQIPMLVQRINEMEVRCASLDGKCGDLATMVGKRDALDKRIAELKIKHKAYETAIRFIEESSDDMKGMVAPRVANRADIYFSTATDGKYKGVELDTSLSMSVGEDFSRSCEYLSAGTRDSAYLSLRLALADVLFTDGAPIVLDDAFVRIDDNRLKTMAKALGEAAKQHQIFIFTHGDRERNALSASNVAFSDIAMND